MKIIDDFLNNITMYRLVLYYLLVLIGWAVVLSLFGVLFFNPLSLFFSTGSILAICWITNKVFAYVFKAPTNLESIYISALILSLIITPIKDIHGLSFIFWVSVWAAASKFIFAINKKHLFNPAAIGVFITGLGITGSASWWVGTAYMMPVVLIGGMLIVKKIRRWDLVLTFLVIAVGTIFLLSFFNSSQLISLITKIFLDSPILFFAFVMLTEPLTTPSDKIYRMIYASLVGFLFAPQLHFGSFTTTPEMALIAGNIFSYFVSPKEKLLLKLKEKIQLSPDIYDFVFGLDKKIGYVPGQYMEWTLGQSSPDSRGSRRYFTLASSPTEEDTIRIGVKFYPNGSSWKKSLLAMQTGDEIVASQLSGEFTLPKDQSKKLVFIAGGIGITPFRSIIKYLMDRKESRVITLIYSVKTETDAVYMDLFNQASREIGLKSIVNVSDRTGFITGEMVTKEVPDYKERIFYLSGPHRMIDGFKKTLSDLGVLSNQIKTDYFPGYV
ncbi:MAG: FAD-binding oxidoreductase [Candidatus Levybacteria bacterium]|nr:FAD-binding oxidoreductase [Candidatus Levybacteria bacterium]